MGSSGQNTGNISFSCAFTACRKPSYDLDRMPGAWKSALPVLGNVLELLKPNFHRVFLQWSDKYGGINRFKFL